MPIPKLIHHLWIDESSAGIPKDVEKNLLSWRDTHPDFTQTVWSMDELETLLENFYGLNVLECVNACQFPAMQSDIIRLALVYEYGGYWNDLKNYAMTSCLPTYQNSDEAVLVEHFPLPTETDPDFVCNSFFAAPKKNKFILDTLKAVCHNINLRKEIGVFGASGAAVFTLILKRGINQSKPYNYTLIRHKDFWNKQVRRVAASYNKGSAHWSARQKVESLYK